MCLHEAIIELRHPENVSADEFDVALAEVREQVHTILGDGGVHATKESVMEDQLRITATGEQIGDIVEYLFDHGLFHKMRQEHTEEGEHVEHGGEA